MNTSKQTSDEDKITAIIEKAVFGRTISKSDEANLTILHSWKAGVIEEIQKYYKAMTSEIIKSLREKGFKIVRTS